MKRILSLTLALLLTVLLLGTAGAPIARAEEDNPYVGLWLFVSQQDGDTLTLYEEAGLRVYLDFRPNGLIYGLAVGDSGAKEEYLTYIVTGENALTLYEEGHPMPGVYDPATGIITVTEEESGVVTRIRRAVDLQMPDAESLIDRTQAEQTYYVCSMTSDGTAYDMLAFVPTLGMDLHDFYLTLRPDGTGYMQFGSQEDGGDITWTATEITAEGNSAPYTREGGHILLTIDEDNGAEFAPKAEVEALLQLEEIRKDSAAAAPADSPQPLTMDILTGTWNIARMEMEGISLSLSALGMEATMTFSPDGTIEAFMQMGESSDSSTMAFEITEENVLVIHEEEGDATGTYDPATDTITLAVPGSGSMILERAAEACEPAPAPTEAPRASAAEAEALVGTWTMTHAVTMGIEVSAQQMGTTMSLELKADGTATMDVNGSSSDVSWSLTAENTVPLAIGEYDMFVLSYDGTVLTLTTAGVDMIFERVGE